MTVNENDVLADTYFMRRLHEARRATDAPASVQLDLARSPLSDQHLVQATQTLGAPADDNRWGFSDVLHDVLSANPNSVPVGDLKQLQGNLQQQGYLPPDQPITGVWDDSFRAAFSRFDRDNFNDQLAGHHALSSPIEAGFRILNDTLPSKVYQGVIGAAKGIVAQTGETFSRGGLAGGALEGAAIGGALGSVVPGLGTAVGAAAGGVVGAVGGFLGSLFGHHESLVDSLSPIDDYAKEGPRAAFEDLGYVLSAASMIRGGGLAVQGAREGIAAFGAARAAQSAAGEEGGSLAAALTHAPVETPGIASRIVGRAVGVVNKGASEKMIDWVSTHGLLSWQNAPLLRGVSGVYTGLSAGQLGARLASGVGSGDSATTIEKAIRDAPELPAYADWASFVLWPKQFFPIKLGSARVAAEAAMGDRSLQPYMHAGQEPGPDGKVLSLAETKTKVLAAMGSSPAERQWSDTRLRLGYGIDRRVGEMKAELSRTGLELDDENVTAVLKADLVKRMRMEAAVQGKSPTATDLLRYSLPDPVDTRNGPMAFAGWLLDLPGEGSFVERLPKFLQAERVAQQTSAGVRDGSIAGIVPGGGAIKTVDRAQLLRQRGQLSEMQREAKRLRGEAESLRVTDPVQSARTFSQAVQTEEAAQALAGEIKGAADAAQIRLTGAPDVKPVAPAPPPEPTRVKIIGDTKPAPRPAVVPEARVEPPAQPVQGGLTPGRWTGTRYRAPIAQITDRAFRETSTHGAKEVLGWGGGELDFATHPDLALGQGSNRGILMEFDTTKMSHAVGYPVFSKPAAEMLAKQGQVEIKLDAQARDFEESLRRVVIRPDADPKYLPGLRAQLKSLGMEETKLADGRVEFRRPGVEPLGPVEEGATFRKGDIVTHAPSQQDRPERLWYIAPAEPGGAGLPRAWVRTFDGKEKAVLAENLHAARPIEAPPGTFVISDDLLHRWQSIEEITMKVRPPPLEGGLPAEDFVRPNIDLAANRFHRYFGKDLGYTRHQMEALLRRAEVLTVNAQRAGDNPNLMSVALRILGFDGAQRSDAVGRFLGLKPIGLADKTPGVTDEMIAAARQELGLPAPRFNAPRPEYGPTIEEAGRSHEQIAGPELQAHRREITAPMRLNAHLEDVHGLTPSEANQSLNPRIHERAHKAEERGRRSFSREARQRYERTVPQPPQDEPALPPADLVPEQVLQQRPVGPVDLPDFETLPPEEKRYMQNLVDGKVARPFAHPLEQVGVNEPMPPTGTVRGLRGFGHYSEIRTKDSWATLGSRVDVDGVPHVVDEIRGEFLPDGSHSPHTVIYGHPESGGPTRLIEASQASRWKDTVAPKADKLIERVTEADPRDQPMLDHIRKAKAEGKDIRTAFREYDRMSDRPAVSLNRFERAWGIPEEQLTRPPAGVVDEGPHWVRVSVDGKEFKVLVRGTGDTPNDFDKLAPETMTDPERIKAHAVDQWRQQQIGDASAPELQIGPDQVEASSNADLARAVQEAGFKDIPEFRRAEELVNALKGRKAPSPELRDLQARVSQARNRLKTLTGTQKGHYTITPARPETPTAGDLHSLARQYTKLADKAFLLEHNARRAAGSDREFADVAKQAKLAQEALGSFVDDLTYRHLISREQGLRAKRVRSSAVADQLKRRAQFAARDVHLPDEVMRSFSDLGYKPVATGEEVLFSSELPRLLEPVGVGDYTRRAAFFDTLGLSPVVFSDRSLFALRGGHETAELDQVLQEHGIKVTGKEARDRIYRTLRRRNSRAAYGPFVVDPEGKRRFFGVDVRDLKMDEITRAFEDISGFNDDTALAVYGALRRGAAFGSEATFRHPLDAARLLGRAMRVTGLQGFSDFIRGAHLSPKPTRQGIRLVGGAAAGAALGALEGDQPSDILKGAVLGAGAGAGLSLAAKRTYGYLPDALVRANTALRYTLSFTFDAGRYSEQNMIAMIDANLPFIMRPQKYLERREGLHSIGLTDGVRSGEPISGRQAWDEAIRYFDRLNGVSYYSTAMDVDRRLFQAGILGFRPRDFETAQAYLLAQRGWDESKVEQTVAKMGRYGIGRSAAEKSANFVFFPFSFSKKLLATLGDFLLQAPGRNLLIHEGLRRYHQSTLDEKFHELIQNHAPVLGQLWRVNNLAYGLSPGRFFLEGLSDDKTATGKAAQILASIFIPSGAATPLAEAAGATGDLAIHAFAPVVLAGRDVKGFADILDRYIPVIRDVRQYIQATGEQVTALTSQSHEVPYAQLQDYSDARRAFKDQYTGLAQALGYSDVDSFLSSNTGAGFAAQLNQLDNHLAARYPTGFQMAQDFTNTERLNDQLLYTIAQKSRRTQAEEEILKLAEMRQTWKGLGALVGWDQSQALTLAAGQIRKRALAFGANDQFYSLYQQIFGTEFGPIRRVA